MRNIYFDLNELLSCDFRCVTLIPTNEVAGESPSYVLHVLAEDDKTVEDFGTKNAQAFEYTKDLPEKFCTTTGAPRHSYLGVPVYADKDARLAADAIIEPAE